MEENTELAVKEETKLEKVQEDKSVTAMWTDTTKFKSTYKMAEILSGSDIVPQSYKGKAGNCLIAIDLANRMQLSPIVVMQNSQVVQGNFTWKGSACRALIEGTGKFTDIEYVEVGDRDDDSWGYYLQAKKNGKLVQGSCVTIKMAKDEGWYGKNGSKWKTMPEQMLKYRCATFFCRSECPEAMMGFYSTEEIKDVNGYDEAEKQKTVISFDGVVEANYKEVND